MLLDLKSPYDKEDLLGQTALVAFRLNYGYFFKCMPLSSDAHIWKLERGFLKTCKYPQNKMVLTPKK